MNHDFKASFFERNLIKKTSSNKYVVHFDNQ